MNKALLLSSMAYAIQVMVGLIGVISGIYLLIYVLINRHRDREADDTFTITVGLFDGDPHGGGRLIKKHKIKAESGAEACRRVMRLHPDYEKKGYKPYPLI